VSSEFKGGPEEALVVVATARDPVEAAVLKGMLDDVGIPCCLLPEQDAPRELLVSAGRLEEARAVLIDAMTELEDQGTAAIRASERRLEYSGPGRKPRGYGEFGAYARIYLWSLLAITAMAALYFLGRAL
jgi:hypothetical protein